MAGNIPPVIHYCWFGKKPLPESVCKNIASWKTYFPGFEIKEWNESGYDVHKTAYTSEAYKAGKYAFVSDYARFDILYRYGGIYFDTDVEVTGSFDDILRNGPFMGFQSNVRVNPGSGMGCRAGLGLFKEIVDSYSSMRFLYDDGTYNMLTVDSRVTGILKKHGLVIKNTIQSVSGLTVYPSDYFSPKSITDGGITITGNTRSIHWYSGSWVPENEYAYYELKRKFCGMFPRKIGMIFSFPAYIMMNIKNHGIKKGTKIVFRKIVTGSHFTPPPQKKNQNLKKTAARTKKYFLFQTARVFQNSIFPLYAGSGNRAGELTMLQTAGKKFPLSINNFR